jgi:hypothetical protein
MAGRHARLSTKIEKRQGQVLSNLARRSLNAAAPQKRSGLRGGAPVLPSRGELITLQHVQKIQDDEKV